MPGRRLIPAKWDINIGRAFLDQYFALWVDDVNPYHTVDNPFCLRFGLGAVANNIVVFVYKSNVAHHAILIAKGWLVNALLLIPVVSALDV